MVPHPSTGFEEFPIMDLFSFVHPCNKGFSVMSPARNPQTVMIGTDGGS